MANVFHEASTTVHDHNLNTHFILVKRPCVHGSERNVDGSESVSLLRPTKIVFVGLVETLRQ